MGCFLVPAGEAIVTTIINKAVKTKEKEETVQVSLSEHETIETTKVKLSTKLGWLNKMLWGGSALLAFEHVWHGEVVPFFPFLSAVKDGNAAEMLSEMSTTGVTMACLVTAAWGAMVAITSLIQKNAIAEAKERV